MSAQLTQIEDIPGTADAKSVRIVAGDVPVYFANDLELRIFVPDDWL